MSERSAARSIIAVMAGVGVLILIAFVSGYVTRTLFGLGPGSAVGFTPSLALGSLAIGLLAEIPGGWVTARLSPSRPYLHAVALVLFLSAFAAVTVFDGFAGLGQAGRVAAANLVQLPGVLLGAWLGARVRGRSETASPGA